MENCIVLGIFESTACPLPVLRDFEYCGHRQICSQDNFCHIFLGNHTGQLPDIWHRASVWRTVSCNAVLNLRHVRFLFYATLNILKKRSRPEKPVLPRRLNTKLCCLPALAEVTYSDHYPSSALASQKSSVTFFSGTTETSFLIFGTSISMENCIVQRIFESAACPLPV